MSRRLLEYIADISWAPERSRKRWSPVKRTERKLPSTCCGSKLAPHPRPSRLLASPELHRCPGSGSKPVDPVLGPALMAAVALMAHELLTLSQRLQGLLLRDGNSLSMMERVLGPRIWTMRAGERSASTAENIQARRIFNVASFGKLPRLAPFRDNPSARIRRAAPFDGFA